MDVLQAMADEVNSGPEWCRPSNIWTELIYQQFEALQSLGVENFKRTVNQWFSMGLRPLDVRVKVLQEALGVDGPSRIPDFDSTQLIKGTNVDAFIRFLGLLNDYCLKLDEDGEYEKFDEPLFGNPLRAYIDDRLVTVDLCLSFIDYMTIRKFSPSIPNRNVLEIGPGSGRLAIQIGKVMPDSRFVLVDIPPSLYISYSHVSAVFPGEACRFYRKRTRESLVNDISNFRFLFLTPNQLELLEDGSMQWAINIDSFGEMALNTVEHYVAEIGRLMSPQGIVYLRNLHSGSSVSLGRRSYSMPHPEAYRLGAGFECLMRRDWPLYDRYSEQIYRKF